MAASPEVTEALDRIDIAYQVMACDPDLADTEAFCRAYGVGLDESANTILMSSRRPKGQRVVCVALATHRIDVNGTVRSRLDVRKISFASPDETREVTGMEIGGVTVPGLPADLPVWIDPAVAAAPSVVIGAGTRSAKIRLAGSDLTRLPGTTVVEGLTFA